MQKLMTEMMTEMDDSEMIIVLVWRGEYFSESACRRGACGRPEEYRAGNFRRACPGSLLTACAQLLLTPLANNQSSGLIASVRSSSLYHTEAFSSSNLSFFFCILIAIAAPPYLFSPSPSYPSLALLHQPLPLSPLRSPFSRLILAPPQTLKQSPRRTTLRPSPPSTFHPPYSRPPWPFTEDQEKETHQHLRRSIFGSYRLGPSYTRLHPSLHIHHLFLITPPILTFNNCHHPQRALSSLHPERG